MEDLRLAIRREMRGRRREISPAQSVAAGREVARWLAELEIFRHAKAVIGYLEHEGEVAMGAVLDLARDAGLTVYLPCWRDRLGVVPWHPGSPLKQVRPGLFEPEGRCVLEVESPALALVPVVAWDRSGMRLGRGAGVYDRLLALLSPASAITRVGIGYDFQEVSRIPKEPWDVLLQYIISESGVVRCSSDNAPSGSLQKGESFP